VDWVECRRFLGLWGWEVREARYKGAYKDAYRMELVRVNGCAGG